MQWLTGLSLEEEDIYMLLPANKSDRMHWVKPN